SEIVITDAKAQLKSTNLPVNQISDSLNFANVSFFGKYFKRYVGLSPQKYRDS
ncbi:MAG: helix-turn-helix domain-containing protein, partial [Bacteroides sp.]